MSNEVEKALATAGYTLAVLKGAEILGIDMSKATGVFNYLIKENDRLKKEIKELKEKLKESQRRSKK